MGYFIFVGLKNPSRNAIMLASLHPACAFTFGTLAFTEYEAINIGINQYTWDVSMTNPITFRDTLDMMFIDTIVLAFLSWYVTKVWPSEFGTHKKWYFFLLPSYWLSCLKDWRLTFLVPEFAKKYLERQKVVGNVYRQVITARVHDTEEHNSGDVEMVTETLNAQINNKTCVDIRGLYKEFRTNTGMKIAVNNLNLTMFSGQITALLGHNGAGKTTTIAMLTGLIPPDAGTAIVEGLPKADRVENG